MGRSIDVTRDCSVATYHKKKHPLQSIILPAKGIKMDSAVHEDKDGHRE